MKRRLAGACLIAAMSATSAGAAQEPRTGSHLPGNGQSGLRSVGDTTPVPAPSALPPRSSDQAMLVGTAMATCMVNDEPAKVRAYLSAPTLAVRDQAGKAFSRSLSRCLGAASIGMDAVEARFSNESLEGFLAAAWVRKNSHVVPAPQPVRQSYESYWISNEPDRRVVNEMAACMADTQPAQVDALLHTAPVSPAEAAATTAIAKMMGPCLVRNATLRTDRHGLRLALATAYYHRLADPAVIPAAAVGTAEKK